MTKRHVGSSEVGESGTRNTGGHAEQPMGGRVRLGLHTGGACCDARIRQGEPVSADGRLKGDIAGH